MSTRAIQFSFILDGLRDPSTDSPLSGGSVEFYSAGTTNAKNVWTEKEKTNAITSVALDSNGQATVYGDGIYKLVIKDSAGVEVSYSPIDNFKVRAVNTGVVEVNSTYTADPDDDLILCDTSGGAFTVNLYAAASFNNPLAIKNTGSMGNSVTIDADGAETIDGSLTASVSDAASQTFYSNGSNWYAAGNSTGTNFTSTSLLFGDTITETAGTGTTTLEVTSVEATDGTSVLDGGTDGSDVVLNATGITGTAIKNENDMSSDSAVHLASQKSIKAYVDAHGVVQRVLTADGAYNAGGATTIPDDATIPQNTEGEEFLTVSITPTSATNKLVIESQVVVYSTSGTVKTAALFQDSTADALAAAQGTSPAVGQGVTIPIRYEMTAGTTSETTFKIRAGATAGTITMNGYAGTVRLGGIMNSFIAVTEYEA